MEQRSATSVPPLAVLADERGPASMGAVESVWEEAYGRGVVWVVEGDTCAICIYFRIPIHLFEVFDLF